NAWTPFMRRFTDERTRELAETERLYDAVRARHKASRWADQRAIFDVSTAILRWAAEQCGPIDTRHHLFGPLLRAQLDVLEEERVIFGFPNEVDWQQLDLAELVKVRTFLRAKDRFLSREQHIIEELTIKLGSVFAGLWGELPKLEPSAAFTVPLVDLLEEPND